MRFEEMVLAEAGDEAKLRFHPFLTVLAGLGADDRAEVSSYLLSALTGEGDGGAVTAIDDTGRRVELRASRGAVSSRFLDDGTAAPRPVGWLAPDVETLRSILLPGARELDGGTSSHQARADDPPELTEARLALRTIEDQRRRALASREQAEASAHRLREIDVLLREAAATADRRAYLAAVAELRQVQAEADAVNDGIDSERVDEHLLDQAGNLDRLSREWREAHNAASMHRRRAGDDRFDDVTAHRLSTIPPEAPADLGRMLQESTMARARLTALEDRLHTLVTGQLAEPADPRVLTLATADQAELWGALARLEAARRSDDDEHIRIGGLGSERSSPVVDALEEAHARWEAADQLLAERRVIVIAGGAFLSVVSVLMAASSVPIALLALAGIVGGVTALFARPWKDRAEAARDEAAALEPLGAATYLAYHLRRVNATFDPSGRDRAELAAAAVVLAERDWQAVAGDVDADDAAAMRSEVQAFAAALRLSRDSVHEVAEIRHRLVSEAVPARDAARQQLIDVLAPYRVEPAEIDGVDSEVVAATVAARIDMGARARQQEAVHDAQSAEREAAEALDELLSGLGQLEGQLAARVEAAHWAIEQAAARHAVRTGARSREQIAADIERIDAEVKRLHRPEFTIGSGSAPPVIDVDALSAERAKLQISLADVERAAEALDDLEAQRNAARARLTALTEELGADDGAIDDLREALLAHLGRAARGGPGGEAVPVVLNDPVCQAPAERRWELMDMLRRLGEKTQVIYLTGDAFIGAWAHRRAEIDETILLLEPVE
jgi:hypothetical protein